MARRWLEAAGQAGVQAALVALYGEIAAEIEARGPACWASGRCCNFERSGHLLYVTGLEAAYALTHAPTFGAGPAPRTLSLPQLSEARARGGCPFQAGNLCSIHAAKPAACRIYFCDRSARSWQQDLAERVQGRLRTLHEDLDLPYFYGEWRTVLEGLMVEREGAMFGG